MDFITNVFNKIDDFMYFPILVIVLAAAGLYFTIRTKGVQIRLFGTACKLIVEKPANNQKVSSFQALMVSTASRVGTGNIVGVSTAICLGGPGACMILGIKRGLFSNEAGVGSAPNASASADVTHPVKQGLVQTVSVYIDTMLLCTATALMCLTSGVARGTDVSGAPYVQQAVSTIFGGFGPIFITIAMVLFAFTTLIGNLYYVDNALAYLNKKKMPSKKFMTVFYICCVAVIFLGALAPMDLAWALADITMGGMTLINIPCCIILSGIAIKALKDFEKQRKQKLNPVFHAKDIGLDPKELHHWE